MRTNVEDEKQYQKHYYIKNKPRLKRYKRWHYIQNRDKYVEVSRQWRATKRAEKMEGEAK